MDNMTLEISLTAPMEQALRMAAWDDESSVSEIMQIALERELRRRSERKKAARRNRIAARLPELAG